MPIVTFYASPPGSWGSSCSSVATSSAGSASVTSSTAGERSLGLSSPGHAFVGFIDNGRTEEKRWGFSSGVLGGIFIDETPYSLESGTIIRRFHLSDFQYINAKRTIERWRGVKQEKPYSQVPYVDEWGTTHTEDVDAYDSKKMYIIGLQDCINFAYDVADAIGGLTHDKLLMGIFKRWGMGGFSVKPLTCIKSIRPNGLPIHWDANTVQWMLNERGWQWNINERGWQSADADGHKAPVPEQRTYNRSSISREKIHAD